MKRIIKNGTIVTGSGSFPGDILIEGEKIRAVGNHEEIETLADKDTAVTDAAGCLVFPGFIDAHTHFDLHVAGLPSGAVLPPLWILEPSMQGKAWQRGLKIGMKRQMGSAPAITASICLFQSGLPRCAGKWRT